MRRRRKLALLAAVIVLVAAVAYLEYRKYAALTHCEFAIIGVNFKEVSLDKATIEILLIVRNRSDVPAYISAIDYEFYSGDILAYGGATEADVTVEPGSNEVIALTVTVEYIEVGPAAWRGLIEGKAIFKVQGVAYTTTLFGRLGVPFEAEIEPRGAEFFS